MPKRNRLPYFFIILLTIGLGLFSRTTYIPDSIYPYLGDALYAMMTFFLIAFLFPSLPPLKVFLICVGICFLMETTQLYDADWMLSLRQTRIGALVLGHGFLWSDLLAYVIGGLVGFLLEQTLFERFIGK